MAAGPDAERLMLTLPEGKICFFRSDLGINTKKTEFGLPQLSGDTVQAVAEHKHKGGKKGNRAQRNAVNLEI